MEKKGLQIMEDIVIEELRVKAYRICLAGIVMLIASIALWWFGVNESSWLYTAVGVVGTIFFGIGSIVAFGRAVKEKPLLTIKWDGINDTSSASAVGFIPYSEIERLEIINIFGQRVIGVTPKNINNFVAKLSKGKQRAAKMNIKMNYPPVSIRLDTAKDMTIEDIFSLLEKRFSDYKRIYN